MTQKQYLKVLILTIAIISTYTSHGQVSLINKVTFVQEGSSFVITKHTDSIILGREPFSIKYFGRKYDASGGKFYSAQIAVIDNQTDTVQLLGQPLKNITYFQPGTGMAPGVNGMYDTVVITNTGHHYLIYENEKEKRVNKLSKNGDYLEFEWKISAAFYQGKDVQFSELKLSTLYFIIFMDRNLNRIVDTDELKVVKATFKE